MSNDQMFQDFVGLSSVLTGYPAAQLLPAFDTTGLAAEYYATMQQRADSRAFLQTLSVFRNIAANFPDPAQQAAEVAAQILADDEMGDIARRIIRLWYLSTWYTNEPPDGDGMVVSANAYTLGLAWDTFQAHPMGYSEFRFGYWNTAPPQPATPVAPEPPAVSTAAAPAGADETPPQLGGRQRGGV